MPNRRYRLGTIVIGFITVSLASADININIGRGNVRINVPPNYTEDDPAPLIILLHGYSGNGGQQEAYMKFTPLSDEYGFLYANPNGTLNEINYRFWDATDACCDFFDENPDDSKYLTDLVEAIRDELSVDGRRIYFVGHSNGGFMSYRMACDHSDFVAAIASLAGATWLDVENCPAEEPVHVLQIHGTLDNTIEYDGGCVYQNEFCYPGAVESVEQWAQLDGCTLDYTTDENLLDLDAGISGKETDVTYYVTDCAPGGAGELWTINRGGHIPTLSKDFSRLVVEWLLAHPKAPPIVRGDLNCDDAIDFGDIDPFVGALSDRGQWESDFPDCNFFNGDINEDGEVDFADVDGFVDCLISGECA